MRSWMKRWEMTWILGLALSVGDVSAQTPPTSPAPSGPSTGEHLFPTGDRATSILSIRRLVPPAARSGESFTYEVQLTNVTRVPLENMNVTEQFGQGFTVTAVNPRPSEARPEAAAWAIPRLNPAETFRVQVTGSGSLGARITNCVNVTFQTSACSTTHIVEPALELKKTAPAEVLTCDPIPVTLTVTNTGNGVARGVKITDELPPGVTTPNGQNRLVFEVGDLAPSQSRQATVELRASQPGSFTNRAVATESGGLTVEASTTTLVRQPQLEIHKTGPAERFVNRPARFEITVSNVGDGPARDATLFDQLTPAHQFLSASHGGQPQGGQIVWNLGTINPGESRAVSLEVTPTQIGSYRNTAAVKAYCAEATTSVMMNVRGIPAILLEVIDIDDPIEVGHNETYEITVLNQGSADDTNIVIMCVLPPEQEYVSGNGPTPAQVAGKTVTFTPLPRLAPKATATYRVTVRGVGEGDVRFKVSMNSDQIQTPVEETESTHIYR